MSTTFPLAKLSFALFTLSIASYASAAGLDRSGQDIKGFFNKGTYAEVDYAMINTDVSGHDNAGNVNANGKSLGITATEEEYVKGKSTGNITPDTYYFTRYGVKTDVNDSISVGVFYDEPYGALAGYSGDNAFVSDASQPVIVDSGNKDPNKGNLTPPIILPSSAVVNSSINDPDYRMNSEVDVHTESWTGLLGFKATDDFQIYGGPVIQKAKARVSLRGNAYGPLTGYEANVNSDTAYGWAAGMVYTKPEIALRAALTYRSEIEHETSVGERVPLLGSGLRPIALGKLGIAPNSKEAEYYSEHTAYEASVTTPESVNINFQTGLSEKYQLMGTLDVRWVPWSDFIIVPPLYNAYSKAAVPEGLALLSYSEDQWKVDMGLAHRFNDRLAGSVVVGWDSGAGNPASSLGPVEGYYSVGGGLKLNVTPEWAISAGGKYLMFGDATGQLPNGSTVSKFEDNDGYIAGVKVSYQSE